MDLCDIQVGLQNGTLVRDGDRIFTAAEWAAIEEAERNADHYDLLQLTKKIQL